MLMRKTVNNDVNKDSPIWSLALLLHCVFVINEVKLYVINS